MRRSPTLAVVCIAAFVLSGCASPTPENARDDDGVGAAAGAPYVVVGVPDSGINPYHEMFHRPDLTAHPCTYVVGLPCDVRALNLSIGVYDTYDEAFAADRAVWESIERDTWYWIPGTPFVAVNSQLTDEETDGGFRLIDATGTGHGAGTTSLVLRENPDALLAFIQFRIPTEPVEVVDGEDLFVDDGIPVDVLSVSMATWQVGLPVPSQAACDSAHHFFRSSVRPMVKASGNLGGSSLHDCWSGDPETIIVGGAYPHDRTSEAFAHREPDVVSYFCPPYAVDGTLDGYGEGGYCGTSWATPMVAGALSRVIFELRRDSGYHGGREGLVLDPVSGLTSAVLRDAMNLTASYEPEPRFADGDYKGTRVPVDRDRPWLQWGWGFYDTLVANETLAHLRDDPAPPKPADAVAYMEGQYALRTALYGDDATLPTVPR